ncbi:unnamed protein product, partial [Symbiodinium sp. KB8]
EFPHRFGSLGGVRVITTSTSKVYPASPHHANLLPPIASYGSIQGGNSSGGGSGGGVGGLRSDAEEAKDTDKTGASSGNVSAAQPMLTRKGTGVNPGEIIEPDLLYSVSPQGVDLKATSMGRAAGLNTGRSSIGAPMSRSLNTGGFSSSYQGQGPSASPTAKGVRTRDRREGSSSAVVPVTEERSGSGSNDSSSSQ